ncbi:4'-phosphopantetheinyl transferase HetI-like isoform X1 [Lolium rigidum]|uniref:4'-phosphopantetheinyl transferase HetI-like isoform X1 n=1 Tax=Lolium rigidum TaxID=89674 RepID=UPI001F5DB9D5|nr:4'-phosphopantetheinyl transferase HetI-like isoform X1 [Lolium rigidum]
MHRRLLRCRAMPLLQLPPPPQRALAVSGSRMNHRLLRCRVMPLQPPPPPLGVSGGRLFASLSSPPPLQSRREVHVWYLCPDEVNDQSQLNMYEELLSPVERKYAASMKVPELRKDAMLSRALLRTTLSRYTDCKIDPRSFEFKKNEFGKPEILWPPDNSIVERPLHFNISHTTSLIACGIAMHAHIGIDIEEKKRNTTKNILSLARRYFTPSEVDYLIAISDSDVQRKEFLKLWTLKEAYVKALGLGFSGAPFNTFSIMLETSKGIRISKVSKVCDDSISGSDHLSDNWQFTLAELNSSHYMSVCVEDDSRKQGLENTPVPVGLKVWKTIPFVEDTLVSGTDALKLIS